MNGEKLSQEEIDALLNANLETNDLQQEVGTKLLSEDELDALGEISNILFGSAATTLSSLLNEKVEITTPEITVIDQQQLEEELSKTFTLLKVSYESIVPGMTVLAMKETDAALIADFMLGGDGTTHSGQFEDIHKNAFHKAMDQMMGSAVTSIATLFNDRNVPSSVELANISIGEVIKDPAEQQFVKVTFQLKIGQLSDSIIVQLMSIQFAKEWVNQLFLQNKSKQITRAEVASTVAPKEKKQVKKENKPLESSRPGQTTATPTGRMNVQPQVQKATFSEFDEVTEQKHEISNLGVLLDVPLQVTVELGRTSQSVKDILELGSGSIIELDKLAGEPVDILINNRHFAKGEVVVIEEN